MQIKKMKPLKRDFKIFVLNQHEKAANKLAKDFENDSKRFLRQTTAYNQGSGSFVFTDAVPTTKIKIKRTLSGVIIFAQTKIIDQQGKNHFIWHLLNSGRDSGPAKSDLFFPIRNSTRTTPNSLSVKPFQGFSGQYRKISKGKFIGGFLGRNWYATTVKRLKMDYKKSKITHKD